MKNFTVSILLLFFTLSINNSFANEEVLSNLKTELKHAKTSERFEILSSISKEYMFSSFFLAEKYARMGLNEGIQANDTTHQLNFYRLIGAIKQLSTQYDSSIYYYQKSVDIAKLLENEYEKSLSELGIANILSLTGNHEDAISVYKNSVNALRQQKDTSALIVTFNNTSSAYISLNQLDSAAFYIKKTLKLISLGNSKIIYATALTNLGDIYFLQNKYTSAEMEYKNAILLFEETESTYNVSYTCIRLSELYKQTKKIELSELYLHRAIDLSEQVGSIELKADAYLKLSEIFEDNSNIEKAFEYFKKHKLLNDSISKINQSSLITEVNNAFQIEEQERELKILNHEITLKKSKITLLYSLIGFFSLLILLIVFFYFKINIKNRELFRQSLKEIQTNNNEEIEVDPKMEELYLKILSKLEKDKVYLDSNLTISKLSELVDSNNNYVSKCINQKYFTNFNSVLNLYRVKEAKMLFRKDALNNYTMAGIGGMCGFTSISVFNRSFKKETGITPSFFVKSLKTDT